MIDFSYILFDVNRYNKEDLLEIANMVSLFFLLEQDITKEELVKRLRNSAFVLKKIKPEQFDVFKRWLKGIVKPRLDKNSQKQVDEILDETSQEEVEDMVSNLGKTLDRIKQDGKTEGLKEGKAEILIKQLLKKFKAIPEEYKQNIKGLDEKTIDVIATDIFDIETLDELEKYFK